MFNKIHTLVTEVNFRPKLEVLNQLVLQGSACVLNSHISTNVNREVQQVNVNQ
jgi:hypothetical protein